MINNDLEERAKELRAAGVSEHSGFPNPASDRALQNLDINKLLIKHGAATYLMSIRGDDWQDIGIFNNDLAVIDRAEPIQPNDIVIWWAGENFVIGYARDTPLGTAVWGTVTATIHRYKNTKVKP